MMMKNPRHDRSCSRADSRLQSSIIHNNYPIHVSLLGIYRYSSDTPQSTHISCFVSAVPPSPVSHAILIPPSQIIAFVTVCITSPRYWLIIWSPTHYQTQTSSLLTTQRPADCRRDFISRAAAGCMKYQRSLYPLICVPPVINIHCLQTDLGLAVSQLPPVTAPGPGDRNICRVQTFSVLSAEWYLRDRAQWTCNFTTLLSLR